MKMRYITSAAACGLLAILLSACGGGGGSDSPSAAPTPTPVASTKSFALATGYAARVTSGSNDNFTLSGTCSGSATIATAAAAAGTFEGVAGFSASQVSTISFTNCLPASNSSTGMTAYDANHVPIGLSIVGGEYAKYEALPAALPASVKVGDTGTISSLTTYADNTKATITGRRVISYAIEADTDATAIANIVTRSYDTSAQLLSTQQSRFRMVETGALTLVSIDVQFSTTSNVHLVYTPH
jgi:hypothetical protein